MREFLWTSNEKTSPIDLLRAHEEGENLAFKESSLELRTWLHWLVTRFLIIENRKATVANHVVRGRTGRFREKSEYVLIKLFDFGVVDGFR